MNTDDKKNFIQYWETGGFFFEEIWRFLVGIHFVILFSSCKKRGCFITEHHELIKSLLI